MDKHPSFSLIPSFRFLIFSLAVSSSLFSLSLFFFWVIRTTNPPFHPTPPLLSNLNITPNKLEDSFLLTHSRLHIISPDLVSTKPNKTKAASFEVKFGNRDNGSSSAWKLPAKPPPNVTYPEVAENSRNSSIVSVSNEEQVQKDSCDVTKGKWVLDDSYPLYTYATCPFIDEGFNCDSNGRLDKDYMKWRWQPNNCHIPRFNGSEMLELIRGKRLVFVGDSLNRNQWESMLCFLFTTAKDPNNVYEARGRRITKSRGDYSFKFVDYKCTVEYHVTHFLVHETKARIGKKRQQTLRIDTIHKGSSRWRGADILVFNTAHWWSHQKTKAGINYYQEGDQVYPRLDVTTAFQRAMMTWATWIDKNINSRKTRVFFRSSSPSHFRGGEWDSGGHCKEASQPSYGGSPVSYEKNMVVEEVLRRMKTPVTLLNITEMSNYRIDGHPSVYGRKSGGVEDCSHWCLPGVPDSWNQLLFFHLKHPGRNIPLHWN